MRVILSSRYALDIGPHVWGNAKYQRIRDRLIADGRLGADAFVAPQPASWDDLALVHTPEYLRKVRGLALSMAEIAQLEVPLTETIVEGFRLMTGGTVMAGRDAVASGLAVHLGGGLHHAFASHGEGFCLFNDVAVAIRVLQRDGLIRRAAVVDCDVHQGNGTAAIFDGDPSVFTFSIHQQHNYPMVKPPSDLDVSLRDRTSDRQYLRHLELAVPQALAGPPDVLFYLAGADPFLDDQLGGLSLTFEGLRQRDRVVLRAARAVSVPVAVVLAGGYARRVDDTVAIHVATVLEVLAVTKPAPQTDQ